jgi:predicted HTH transcriptional regulator
MPLTRTELVERLAQHEDSFVERKLEGGDFKPTLVAFANSVPPGRDAVLYIGIRDDGEVVGLANPDALQKKIQQFCQDTCYPPIAFTTELVAVKEKPVLAIVIPPSPERPRFAGSAYTRLGTKNMPASPELFAELITSRSGKAAELLRYRQSPITVISMKARPGHPEAARVRAGTPMSPEPRRIDDCSIRDVNPYFVRFEQHGTRFSEPLANIEISYDEERHRPLLIIHLDGA